MSAQVVFIIVVALVEGNERTSAWNAIGAPDNRQVELLLFLTLQVSTVCGPWSGCPSAKSFRWFVYQPHTLCCT